MTKSKKKTKLNTHINAQVVKLADTPDLGSGAVRCVGSTPILGNLIFFKAMSLYENRITNPTLTVRQMLFVIENNNKDLQSLLNIIPQKMLNEKNSENKTFFEVNKISHK